MPYELRPWELQAHYDAIEYMAKVAKERRYPPPKNRKKSAKFPSKAREILRSWRRPIIKSMRAPGLYE